MEDFKLNTGDIFADAALEKRLADSPEFWALVSYFEKKGLLDRADFLEFLSESCGSYVKIVNQAHQMPDD